MIDDKKYAKYDSKEGLFIPSRQLSLVSSGVLLLAVFVFMGGYFLGRNYMIEPFVAQVEQASFADQVYTSLYARYDHDGAEALGENVHAEESDLAEVCTSVPDEQLLLDQVTAVVEVAPVVPEKQSSSQLWYAPLVGYAKEQSATAFVRKLQRKGIAAHVKAHTSSSPKGRTRRWYQVVTAPSADKDTLQMVVNTIAQQEKLKDVHVIPV